MMKFHDKTIKVWHILAGTGLVLGLVLALFISLQPSTVFAQATAQPQSNAARAARMRNGNGHAFGITGTVAAANATQVQITLNLPKHMARRGQGKAGVDASKPMTFTVDAESMILDKNLSKVAASALTVGSTVTVFPKSAWGEPAIRLLFVGEPSQLATFEFHGQLVKDSGNTLVLKPHDGDQFNVSVDATTTWLNQGIVGRPAQIRPGLPLRVLGMKSANGDVKAVLITAVQQMGRMGMRARPSR